MRILLLLFLAWSCEATVHYVDPATGNDSNNGTSTGTAWAHLPGTQGISVGSGWVISANGDTVVVKGGSTNAGNVMLDYSWYRGSASTYDSVVVQSGHLFTPQWGTVPTIIDCSNSLTWGVGIQGNGTADLQGLTLDGFEIRNVKAGAAIPWDPASGSGCINLGSANIGANWNTLYVRIKRCYLHDSPRATPLTSDQGFGIECHHGIGNCIIEYCTIGSTNGSSIGTKGIELYGTNNIVRNNFIAGCQDHEVVMTSDYCDFYNNVVFSVPPYVHEPHYGVKINDTHNDVWNNIIYSYFVTTNWNQPNYFNNYTPFGLLNDNTVAYADRFNRVVFNTFINGNSYDGNVSPNVNIGPDNLVSNNVVAANILAFATNGTLSSWYHVQLSVGVGGNSTTAGIGNVVTNNDLWGAAAGSQDTITTPIVGAPYFAFNTEGFVMANSPFAGVTWANLLEANPQFAGGSLPTGLDASFHPNSGYFALTATTPAGVVSSGVNPTTWPSNGAQASSKFSLDILGRPRTFFFSMGAYEFQSFPPVVTNVNLIFTGKGTASGKVIMQ